MDYKKYDKYINERLRIAKENQRRIIEKFTECEKYVADNLLNSGCVFTNRDEMLKSQKFMIWVEQGSNITHKILTFSECGISPLVLLPYPQYN